MRISDWSSDLCSSDLLVVKRWLRLALPILAAGLVVLALFGLGLDLNAPLGWSVDSGWMRDFFPAGYRPDLWGVLREATLGALGRASGREACVSTCRSWGSPYPLNNNTNQT